MGGGGAGAEATKAALRATDIAGGDCASVPPVEQQQQKEQPAPLPSAGSGADGSAAAVPSCGEEDQADDEQVERFYALLANIRALRGLCSAGDGGGAGPASGRGRKRARGAEPPWTPAFRLEDFDHEVNQGAAGARCAVMKNQGTGGGAARRPAAADDGHGHEEDGVAEAARGGNKLGRRRVAARG